ncbi:hypothetical protein [Thiolapillus sp.]
MSRDRLKGWMLGGLLAVCAFPLSLQARDVGEELDQWRQDMSRAVLEAGVGAAEQMLAEMRRRLKLQLARDARDALLLQESPAWRYARQEPPGPRWAAGVNHGPSLAGDIP